MAVVRKKQDDKYLKALRELVTSGAGNRQCFDCGQKGPTYVNMTIGSFVCTRCSGVLRGLTPPHRVKSISMATFTQEEIDFLKAHGNELCAKTWLGLWDPKRVIHQDQRELMIDKYERKRYYLEPASPLKSLTNAASLKTINAAASNTSIASTVTNGSLINHQSHNNNNNNNSTMNNLNGTSGAASSNGHSNGIHLTPPQSQRTSANGLHKSANVSATAVSRPQHHLQHLNGFPHEAFGGATTNGVGGVLSSALNASIGSTGTLSDTSSCASANGFGGDSDFVADFGSANIFDATSAGSVGSPAVSSASSVASSNGYAKIQPIMGSHHNFMNGNGNKTAPAAAGSTTENFADFDHAPIYNAAEIAADPRYRNYQFSRKKIIRKKKKSIGDETTQPPQTATNNSASSAPQPPTQSSSATHEKTGEITTMTTNTFTTSSSSSSSNLFVNFFPTPPPLPPPPSPQHHHHSKGKNATAPQSQGGGSGVFLKCDIQRRSSSDLVYSESTSNFNDPFDDFSDMVNRRDAKTNEARSSASTKFTPLAMAAHATAMAVLGNNYHFNASNGNPFERQAAGSAAGTTGASAQWPTLWEESADDLAAAGHGESETPPNGALAAKGSHHNDFGYSLLMNNAATAAGAGGGGESPGTRPSHTQLQQAHGEEPQLELEEHNSSTMISTAFTLPIPNGIHRGQSVGTASASSPNNNNNLSSTPAEDRYAALKDLDEQLRESKAVAAAAATIVASNVVDSFGQSNTHQQQQQHQHQNGMVANPFQQHQQQHQQQQQQSAPTPQLYGQMTVIPNGYHHHQGFYNYNGMGGVGGGGSYPGQAAMMGGGPNGCGFGFGAMQQQINATSVGGGGGGMMMATNSAFNNPFAATGSMNSNNPFL